MTFKTRVATWLASLRRELNRPVALLVVFILANVLLGATTFNRFGENWDEDYELQYGRDVVEHLTSPASYWESYGLHKYYGPAYFVALHVGTTLLHQLFRASNVVDVRHFLNFVTFQLGTVALFSISRRIVGAWPALVAAVLFGTQPLLFGHAFINHKDAPFLAFFSVAVALGLRASDAASGEAPRPSSYRREWSAAAISTRLWFVAAAGAMVLVSVELLWLQQIVLPAIESAVRGAYLGRSPALVGILFKAVAANASTVPLAAYLHKAQGMYEKLRWIPVAISMATCGLISLRTFPSLKELTLGLNRRSVPLLLVTGGIAGIATSIRVSGVLSLGLVVIAILANVKRGLAPTLLILLGAWAVVAYATWPYLWSAPVPNLLASLHALAHLHWSGSVLFEGQVVRAGDLPWYFLPKLMILQFTLPVVILAPVGLLIAASRAARDRGCRLNVPLLMAWLLVPIVATNVAETPNYGNFRHVLFVIPPLFVFSAMALDAAARWVRPAAIRALLVLLTVCPGIFGILALHPYEYIYYNPLQGGVRGAFRAYELDYWCTSYREAMEFINNHSPVSAEIAVAPPSHLATRFARADLSIFVAETPEDVGLRTPSMGLGCGRGNNDMGFFPDQPTVWAVTIEGVPLSVVRDLEGLR